MRTGGGVRAGCGVAGERGLADGAGPAAGEGEGPVSAAPPAELSARVPAEVRGAGRDDVRLMVSRGRAVSHHAFRELPGLLRPGDVLVVNTSATLPAAVTGRLAADGAGEAVVVHFSTRGDDGRWAVELREPDGRGSTRPGPAVREGAVVRLPGGARLVAAEPLVPGSGRLRWVSVVCEGGSGRERPGVAGLLERYGRPIRYGYTERDQPLAAYQTVFARPEPDGAGSAEMPSAARPFTAPLVAELVGRGVWFAALTLHTGVASAEAHEPPYPERYEVPAATARLVNAARAGGGRIVAVGTTAVRALESATGPDGTVRAARGWTDLVVTPRRGVRAVDGLLTGLHEPEASHLLMLEAVAGRAALRVAYAEALGRRYLWHEFGDVHLILGEEMPY